MKRLLRISLNSAIFSFIPILSWFILGILVDKDLPNVFMLTYPIQFIWRLMVEIFGTGANITKFKDQDNDAILSGMTLGIAIGFIIFSFITINVDSYIDFMGMDVNIYREFTIYSIIQLYVQLVFGLVMEKLYFDGQEKLGNKYCLTLNLLNLIVLVISALIFTEKLIIVIVTLLSIITYTAWVTIKQYQKFNFRCNILHFIKYNSVDIFDSLIFFVMYFFGISNVVHFGIEYATAMNFVALVTDTQWDAAFAVATVAKIDISQNRFNYKEHRGNAYKLIAILLSSSLFLFFALFNVFGVNIGLALIYLGIESFNFIIYPIYEIKTYYLQLEWSATKMTINKLISSGARMLMSFLNTPFCTGIGQATSAIYQAVTVNAIFFKQCKVKKNGEVVKK